MPAIKGSSPSAVSYVPERRDGGKGRVVAIEVSFGAGQCHPLPAATPNTPTTRPTTCHYAVYTPPSHPLMTFVTP